MFREIKNYILDNDFQITIFNNKVNIRNYTKIINIQKNIILIDDDGKTISIYGKDMSLKKLLDDEILIVGVVKKIELE